jgi:hypothetical protein
MNKYFFCALLILNLTSKTSDSSIRELIQAARINDIPSMQKLLMQKVPIDAEIGLSGTALLEAVHGRQVEAVRFLIQNKARPFWRYGNGFRSALDATLHGIRGLIKESEYFARSESEYIQIIEILLSTTHYQSWMDSEAKEYSFGLPLHFAVTSGLDKMVDLLLIYGINAAEKTNHNQSACDIARLNRYYPESNKRAIQSLEMHTIFQEQVQNPTRSLYVEFLRKGYFGLVQSCLYSGIHPTKTDLGMVRFMHSLLKRAPITYKLPNSEYSISFTERDKEIYSQAYREIGKKLISYLRITTGIGCKTYPAICKKGLESSEPNLPKEIVRHIAWYAIT